MDTHTISFSLALPRFYHGFEVIVMDEEGVI